MLQHRCGIPISILADRARPETCTCTSRTALHPDGTHCFNCPKDYLPSKRHNRIAMELTRSLQYAKITCTLEQRTHLRGHDHDRLTTGVCDIQTAPWPTRDNRPLAIDVTVAQPNGNSLTPGAAAAAAEERKEELYQQPITHNMEFMPFAIEQHGRFGAKALKLVHRISTLPQVIQGLQDQGYRTHDPTTGKPYRIVVGMVKNWIMQRISTALMQGMAACVHERLDNIQRERTPPEFRDLPPLGQDGFGHG